MEKEIKEEEKRPTLSGSAAGERPIYVVENYFKLALIIIAVIALGLLAINQGMGFFYKVHFLKSPCDLCGELNPRVQECIDVLNAPRASYWTPEGWTDPFAESNNTVKINLSR